MIRVLLFSSFREELNSSSVEVSALGISRISCLVEKLERLYGKPWGRVLKGENTLVSVNQIVVHDNHHIGDGDEVAFFPPVTGG